MLEAALLEVSVREIVKPSETLLPCIGVDEEQNANEELMGTLKARREGGGQEAFVAHGFNKMAVRRLTPVECERLQGFPDGHTDIPGGSDSSRYKALGNSMAVPVMRWIGERIAACGLTVLPSSLILSL